MTPPKQLIQQDKEKIEETLKTASKNWLFYLRDNVENANGADGEPLTRRQIATLATLSAAVLHQYLGPSAGQEDKLLVPRLQTVIAIAGMTGLQPIELLARIFSYTPQTLPPGQTGTDAFFDILRSPQLIEQVRLTDGDMAILLQLLAKEIQLRGK